jgi:DNA-binding GntR family transcriptional regulator
VNKQERTYEILRDRIHAGMYPPLARLNIDGLARELGVSPIPVREALRRLEAQGWVRFRPNAGAVVSPVDETSWEQAMVALAVLEGAATAEAMRHLRAVDLTRLRKIAAEMQSQDDPVRFGQLNRRLHAAIVAKCGNAVLLDLLQQTHDRLDRVRPMIFSYLPERAEAAAAEHARLLELLQAGDAAEVERYARWHKLQTVEAYRASRSASPDARTTDRSDPVGLNYCWPRVSQRRYRWAMRRGQ